MQPFTFYETAPIWLIVVVAALGLLVGSFLNVVIHRLPIMLQRGWRQECELLLNPDKEPAPLSPYNLFVPASRCPSCQQKLAWYWNIPVLSFLALLGRCRYCKSKISWRYPMLELLTAVLSGLLAWMYGWNIQLVAALLFTWFLLPLLFIDFEHQLLPDNLTLPLLWLGLIFNLSYTFASLSSAVIGAIIGYLFFWSVYWIFKLLTKKEGMGYGDFKLLAALAAWTGWQYLLMLVLFSGILGIVINIATAFVRRHSVRQAMPYGPALVIAGWITLVWGPNIADFYWQLTGNIS
jgi:leader peptidase (prepilin peptidase)/N-methyltransferase